MFVYLISVYDPFSIITYILFFPNLFCWSFLVFCFLTDTEDGPDFNDFNNDLSTKDDRLFDDNVMEGIELGCDGGAIEREEENTVVQDEYEDTKDLECPSLVELFLTCHLMMGIDFYSFMAETDMRDPQLHVG